MSKFLSIAVMCSLALPAMALAQGEMVEEDVETVEVDTVTTEEPPPTPAIEEVPPPKVAADMVEADPEEEGKMIDGLSWMAMASAFYRIGGYSGSGVLAGPYNNLLGEEGDPVGYPYTGYNGFGLNFVGGMVAYTGEKFGVTVDLRWGTGAPLLTPLAPVKQGYVTWLPTEKLSIDFGFFDTIFGAEVADEWENANYTRGALYFLRQPFNHMGARMGVELTDSLGFTLMLTNGGVFGGSPVDNNETPTIGWQFAIAPADAFGLYIGGNHGASGDNDNRSWENFFDWVMSISAGPITILLNGDYTTSPIAGEVAFLYGHSGALIIDATDKFSIGLRGEHLSGNSEYRDNFGDPYGFLATGTITLRYKPVEYLVISLEGRGEWTSRDIYFERGGPVDPDGNLLPSQSKNYAVILGFSSFIGN